MKNVFKQISKNKGLVFLVLFVIFQGHAFAQLGDSRSFAPMLDFLGRILNFILGIAGSVFAIMIFYSAIKYATALGDPKGLQGAKDTLTLAIIGLFVVLGAFTILTLITSILGIGGGFINNPVQVLRDAITVFMDRINLCNAGGAGCDFGILVSF